MGYYNFAKDIEDEKKFKAYLEKKKLDIRMVSAALGQEITESEWMEGNFPDFDQKVTTADGAITTIEWKLDQKCLGTKNCYLEFLARGKSSGIAATKADLWAHVVYSTEFRWKLRFGIWRTSDLKEMIESGLKDGSVTIPDKLGGDKKKTKSNGKTVKTGTANGYLVKEADMFSTKILFDTQVDTKTFLNAAGIQLKY